MVPHALSNQTAVVEKNGMKNYKSVNVIEDSIGMDIHVSSVWMEKIGMKIKDNVFVLKELNGMANFV